MNIEYKCELCNKTVKIPDKSKAAPECCNKPMKRSKPDKCTRPDHAEHARSMKDEDACDDGRAG